MLIDTHSHLNFKAFDNDRDEVAQKCLDNDVWLINVGSNYATSKIAVEMAGKYKEGVWAAVGLHPINIMKNEKRKMKNDNVKCKKDEDDLEEIFNYERYKNLAKSEKVVAIGEIGLDANGEPEDIKEKELFWQKQKEVFLAQMRLARELELPVILHCRKAHQNLIEILRNFQFSIFPPDFATTKSLRAGNFQTNHNFQIRGVIHCFTGSWKQAQQYLEMGLYLGFNGIIFKLDLDEVIAKSPMERILVETDCPFLTPPNAANERNEPINVKYVIQKIAEIKKTTFDQVAEITAQNAQTLFCL